MSVRFKLGGGGGRKGGANKQKQTYETCPTPCSSLIKTHETAVVSKVGAYCTAEGNLAP